MQPRQIASVADRFSPDLADLPHGWFHHGPTILTLLEQYRPQVVVELGSWLGASAIATARAIARWGGVIYCVDTWAGELTADGGSPSGGQPLMVLSCARAMVQAGISARVRLIPARTSAAAQAWTGSIDWLYVDADHSEAGCLADLRAWAPHVRPGGLLVGDDYGHPRYPGVARAWDAFALEHDLALIRVPAPPPLPAGLQLVYATV